MKLLYGTWDNVKTHDFVSNSGSPLKGAHQVLKALPIILRQYPDTVVNFCGSSVMSSAVKDILRFQGYHLYLRRLVKNCACRIMFISLVLYQKNR